MSKSSKTRNRKQEAEEIEESINGNFNPNPIKRQIKVRNFPWTEKQKDFFKVALHPQTKVVFVNGPAGTSKTLLSVYCSLQMLNMKIISDFMYLRSSVESSDQRIGFLPGSAEEKLAYYKIPLLEKLDELLPDTTTERLEKEGRISMFPINFARGVNWSNKCIIMDEAQNCTTKEITTILTRLGSGSKCFVLADPMQTDLHEHKSGFSKMYNLFKDDQESMENGVYTFEFNEDDVMRSELVKFLVKKLKHIN
jgi:phosphate starvation-inducible PhoH-like protein